MSAEAIAYLDSSAIVKLVVAEPESEALAAYLEGRPSQATSALARAEVVLAVGRSGSLAVRRAKQVLRELLIVALDDVLLDAAGELAGLRTLDAIHVATALAFGDDLGEVVTYDTRMSTACAGAGIAIAAPA